MNKAAFIIMSVLLALVVSGCSSLQGGEVVSAAVQPGSILFKDDFSNPQSGWETWTESSGSMVTYTNGGLRIYINETQFDYWSRPGVRLADARLEVDAIKLGGPNDNDFGLICRYQDRDNFYAFLISSDGYAGILKVKDGKYQLLSGHELTYADAIRQGEALNHLRGDCVGNKLSWNVNGKDLMSVTDADFKAGEIGILGGTGDTAGADLFFDNFWAYKP
jgi:hypothetical protein